METPGSSGQHVDIVTVRDTGMSHLLNCAGHEPLNDDDEVKGAVKTAWMSNGASTLPSNNEGNLPIPGVREVSSSETVIVDSEVQTNDLVNAKSELKTCATSTEAKVLLSGITTSPKANDTTMIFQSRSGEDLHIVDDLAVVDIEDNVQQSPRSADEFNINDLPQELLHKIFTFLSQRDLCRSVAGVCKVWRGLAYDPEHWQQLDFKDRNAIPGTLIQCIRRATRLKQLKWHNDLTLEEVVHIGNHCKLLVELDLGFCENLNAVMMRRIVDGCPLLEFLNLEGCRKIDHDCVKVIGDLRKLHDINLSHCTHIQDESVSLLAKQLQVVKKFNIDGIAHIRDEAIMDLVNYQKENLEVLELDGAELSDDCMEKIATCPKLRKLGISFAELLTGKSLRFIRSMETLRSLRLKKGADFCGGALHHMFEVGKLKNLTSLNMTECTNIEDSVISAIVRCCGANLKNLSLCWCWNVTDAGLHDIVLNCKKMEFLDLLGLDKIYGDILREVPDRMPNLVYLNLQQCNRIQDHIVESLVREKIDLVAFNYYGEEFSAFGNDFG